MESNSVENCNQCGICNASCPIYMALLTESAGPRFKAHLAKRKEFSDIFYLCTDCGACARSCPANIDLKIRQNRAKLVKNGRESISNRQMVENIRQFGSPLGDPKKLKKQVQIYT